MQIDSTVLVLVSTFRAEEDLRGGGVNTQYGRGRLKVAHWYNDSGHPAPQMEEDSKTASWIKSSICVNYRIRG